jgi:predicted transcriptional regulator
VTFDEITRPAAEASVALSALARLAHHATVVSCLYPPKCYAPKEDPLATKARTVRLDEAVSEELEAIAAVDRRSVNDVIHEAVEALLKARRQDPEFRDRLEASLERNLELLERLSQP